MFIKRSNKYNQDKPKKSKLKIQLIVIMIDKKNKTNKPETIVNIKLPFALLYFFSFNIAASYLKVEKALITVNAAKKIVNSPN